MAPLHLIGFFLIIVCFFSGSLSSTFTITNNCPHPIWPGTLAGAGTPQLSKTGFQLSCGQSVQLTSSPGWSGRIWARTGCSFDESGVGACQTGDCGGKLECSGMGASPPASLFEITLGKGDAKDFYDVSIVDGYNLPILAVPHSVAGGCNATGCVYDLNMGCPKELQVVNRVDDTGVIACKSACEAFGLDQYCCSGQFANPTTCKPSFYSAIFKRACPRAYSYAFDDGTSTFTCNAYDYTITFCPQANGVRGSREAPPAPAIPAPIASTIPAPVAPVMHEPTAPAPPAPVASTIPAPDAPVMHEPTAPAPPAPVASTIPAPDAPVMHEPTAPAPPDTIVSERTYGDVGLVSSSNILAVPMSIIFLLMLNF